MRAGWGRPHLRERRVLSHHAAAALWNLRRSARTRIDVTAPGRTRQRVRTSTRVAALIDTNVLVYRFDPRDRRKQQIATELPCRYPREIATAPSPGDRRVRGGGQAPDPRPGAAPGKGRRASRSRGAAQPVRRALPQRGAGCLALRGSAAYQLSWFDAHLWAHAEHFGFSELVSEDFQHDRLYGTVRTVDPFRDV